MITGFNTDIEHEGVVYHVQTEDKGVETPLILSLVYSGGTILASKRARYEDLIASGYSEEALSERLTRQHKLICAAIHAGRIDDLKRMTQMRVSERGPAPQASGGSPPQLEILRGEAEREVWEEERRKFEAERARLALQSEKERAALAEQELETIANAEKIARPQEVIPVPPAPYPLPDLTQLKQDPRRESVMGDFAEGQPGLHVTLLGHHEFHSGETQLLKVLVGFRTGNQEQAVAKAGISVKILGTTFRPQLYLAKTQDDGVAVVVAQIPKFTSGRAAIVIKAAALGEETELRRIILPG